MEDNKVNKKCSKKCEKAIYLSGAVENNSASSSGCKIPFWRNENIQ